MKDYEDNTPETVYNIIYSVVFGGMNGNSKKYPKLDVFIDELFDLSKQKVIPFNEFETANIRFIFKINWLNILKEYKEKGIDLTEVDTDLEEYSTRLFKYVHGIDEYKEEKTRG